MPPANNFTSETVSKSQINALRVAVVTVPLHSNRTLRQYTTPGNKDMKQNTEMKNSVEMINVAKENSKQHYSNQL